MILHAEVTKEGLLRVKDPLKQGDEVLLEVHEQQQEDSGKGSWSEIEKILKKIDLKNFPRRTNEEILNDIHEFRES